MGQKLVNAQLVDERIKIDFSNGMSIHICKAENEDGFIILDCGDKSDLSITGLSINEGIVDTKRAKELLLPKLDHLSMVMENIV